MDRFLFQPKHRLLTQQSFSRVFEQNSMRASRGAILLLAARNDLGHPRLGLVIRKKFVKTAAGRNLIKRLAREEFRLRQHQLQGVDIIVLNRAGSDELAKPELRKLYTKAFDSLERQLKADK